jgi:hypothetical protein
MSSLLTFTPGNHSYWLADKDTGKKQRVPSVSALKKTLHTFDGERWYIAETAAVAADHFDELAGLAPTSRRDRIKSLALEAVAQPREFGTAVHHYVERLWTGEPVDVPEEYAAHVTAAADWFTGNSVGIIHAETMGWAGPGFMGESPMAGTIDMVVRHPRLGVGVFDLKTWQASRAGTPRPAEWAFQLAAYAQMEHLVVDGNDMPMPVVDWLGVLHVGPTGADLWTVPRDSRSYAEQQVEAARFLKAQPKPTMEKTA